ncbi:MAG: elongator complex protein 3 [Fusobacteriaceae bacterium]
MRHYNIPIFINHVGCPNSCVFCNQKKINGLETDTTPEQVKKIIDEHLNFLPTNSEIEVAFFGGTFTGISSDLQKKYLEVVEPYLNSGHVKGIRLSTRPDYIDENILEQLKKYGVKVIELGVQSLNQKVLDKVERNYKVEQVKESIELIKKYEIDVGIQMMIGLPASTKKIDIDTAKEIIKLKPAMVRIYPSLVLAGTKMEQMFLSGEYSPYTLDEAVDVGKEIYKLFELEKIKIIRVGLQPSDDLRADGVIIAGPFHPAFRELIEGEIYFDFLSKFSVKKDEFLFLYANNKIISKIVGINGINKIKLGKKLKIKINDSLSVDKIMINNICYTRDQIILEGKNKCE